MPKEKKEKTDKPKRRQPIAGRVCDDGTIVEMVYTPTEERTSFIVGDAEQQSTQLYFTTERGAIYHPYPPTHGLLTHSVVLFPETPAPYVNTSELLAEIRRYIHRYVDVSPRFEAIAAYYVLLSWVHDAFRELPYLRVRGDYGSGKSRFLLIVGSICYRPIFASGASTVAPLFHILDGFGGTLVVDEADIRFSDEKADFVKILNNGNVKGFPVLRCESRNGTTFEARGYRVFGPKIVAMRGSYEDTALESRFISEDMTHSTLRADIPISLPDAFQDEAQTLRNKLLMYRFRNRASINVQPAELGENLDPRIRQVFEPIAALVDDETMRGYLKEIAKEYQEEARTERGLAIEARVLETIRLLSDREEGAVSLRAITDAFISRFASDTDHRVTIRYIGTIVRKSLGLKTRKSNGVYVIDASAYPRLNALYRKYDLE